MTALVIRDHRLAFGDGSSRFATASSVTTLEHISERAGAPMPKPLGIIFHYAVTDSLHATLAAQRARDYWAHVSVDGWCHAGTAELRITQALPCNVSGRHAGASEWRGLRGLNGCTIGVEIANPGPLVRDEDGVLRTTYGRAWDESDALETGPLPGYPRHWTHWARYSTEEMAACLLIALAAVDAYPSLRFAAGHQHVSPGRKFDPGPAFRWDWLSAAVGDHLEVPT